MVAPKLGSYFEQSQLLTPYQGAYCSGMLFAVDTIIQALDARQIVCTAFLDLIKAFDSRSCHAVDTIK